MDVIGPGHSIKENRYHNNTACGPGSEIPAHNRVAGTVNKPICGDCGKVNDAKK